MYVPFLAFSPARYEARTSCIAFRVALVIALVRKGFVASCPRYLYRSVCSVTLTADMMQRKDRQGWRYLRKAPCIEPAGVYSVLQLTDVSSSPTSPGHSFSRGVAEEWRSSGVSAHRAPLLSANSYANGATEESERSFSGHT